MKKNLLLVSLAASFLVLSSCSQQYDWATMDKTITVGGEEFVFPLGHTQMNGMKVDSLLEGFSTIKELKTDDDGNYYFNYSDSTQVKIGGSAYATDLDTVWNWIQITGIPDYMRGDARLDLSHSMIRMNVKSDKDVPIKIGSRFKSLNINEFTLASTSVNFSVAHPSSQGTNFVIANEDPKLEGYTYKYEYGDIDTLVHTLPTQLGVGLLPEISKTNEEVNIKMCYDFTIPLRFGPDLKMSFRDTISGMPDLLRDVMEKNDVCLIGTASSTLPVNLSFYVRMLDESGKYLEIKSDEGKIPGTDDTSIPKDSEYRVQFTASSNAKKISKMEMVFTMSEGTKQYLQKDNCLKMDIQAAVPGGIDIKIED